MGIYDAMQVCCLPACLSQPAGCAISKGFIAKSLLQARGLLTELWQLHKLVTLRQHLIMLNVNKLVKKASSKRE